MVSTICYTTNIIQLGACTVLVILIPETQCPTHLPTNSQFVTCSYGVYTSIAMLCIREGKKSAADSF